MRKQYCVITNDLQYDLISKNREREKNVERAKPSILTFLATMRRLNVPIIHLQLIYDEGDKKIELHNGVIPVLRGTPGAEMDADFVGSGDIIVEKKKDSGFFETTLDETLKALHVDTLIILGMQAQICIQTTAADAHFRGYDIIVPSDGVVSTKESDRERALQWLGSYCAVVAPLTKVAAHVEGRELLDLRVPGLA